MKKLIAIILSILFCITLTCCGTEDVLAGLPEIPHNGTKYYDNARVEYGDWYEGAYPRDEYPYPDGYPTVEQAEADGAYISFYSEKEKYAKNASALERFVKNVNCGVEDSLYALSMTKYGDKPHITSSSFYSYRDGKVYYSSYNEHKGEISENVWCEGNFKFVGRKTTEIVYFNVYGDEMHEPGIYLGLSYYRHFFTPLEEGVNAEQIFVDVSGVHEGEAETAPYYEQYPFEESFPSPKQVFDDGGVVIFDKEDIAKAYNTAAIDRFRQNLKDKVPDTLLVYTDNGKATVVMYTYTGSTLIVTEDIRGYDKLAQPYTAEYYGEPKMGKNLAEAEKKQEYSASYLKEYKCWSISVFVEQKESVDSYSGKYIFIPRISYVSKYVVPESEAKNYR